jgi:hypothetical protein
VVEAGVFEGALAFAGVAEGGFGVLEVTDGGEDDAEGLPGGGVLGLEGEALLERGDGSLGLALGEKAQSFAVEGGGVLAGGGGTEQYEKQNFHGYFRCGNPHFHRTLVAPPNLWIN